MSKYNIHVVVLIWRLVRWKEKVVLHTHSVIVVADGRWARVLWILCDLNGEEWLIGM